MAGGFEFLEHTADLKFRAFGGSLEEALIYSARAFTEATCGECKIEPAVVKNIILNSPDLEHLVHDWLSELIFLFSTEHLLFSQFDVKIEGAYALTAKIRGEKFNPKRHKLYKEVKAATYHDMKIENRRGKWVIEVVCDT